MSRIVVVDASVAVKWFMTENEAGVDEAMRLIEDHLDSTLALVSIPHMRTEVLNTLWRRHVTLERTHQALDALDDLGLAWLEPDNNLVASAAEVAMSHNLTAYDSLYVAAALALDAELATSDRAIIASGACEMLPIGPG